MRTAYLTEIIRVSRSETYKMEVPDDIEDDEVEDWMQQQVSECRAVLVGSDDYDHDHVEYTDFTVEGERTMPTPVVAEPVLVGGVFEWGD